MIYTLFIIVASFMNGMMVQDWINETKNESNKYIILGICLMGTLGFLFALLAAIIRIYNAWWKYISHTLQITFWWNWWFGSFYNNLSEDVLEKINHKAKTMFGIKKNEKTKMSLADRHYLYCFKLIRKRYNIKTWNWVDNENNFLRK